MTERRALEELMTDSGKITVRPWQRGGLRKAIVAGLFSSRQRIAGLSRIPYPKRTQARLEFVKGLGDLPQHSIGQGLNWGDVTICGTLA